MSKDAKTAQDSFNAADKDYKDTKADLEKQSENLNTIVQDLAKEPGFDSVEFKDAAFEKAPKEEPKVASPEKKQPLIRPTTPVNNADYEKKEKQKPKFLKVQEKVE